MRRGEQSMPTIQRVEAEVEKINSASILPPGVRIERIYDRSDLINVTTRTVLHNMLFGIVLIFLRAVAVSRRSAQRSDRRDDDPVRAVLRGHDLVLRGESANLLSVGAIDFGLIVDATVIMVENIFRHLAEPPTALRQRTLQSARRASRLSGKLVAIFASASEVNTAIFFSAAIIIAGFVPLFTMTGVEGHIFGPMAKTYAYAIAGGLIATFTSRRPSARCCCRSGSARPRRSSCASCTGSTVRFCEVAVANRIVMLGGAALLLALAGDRVPIARSRVPAEARGRQSVDTRHAARHHFAGGGQRLRQPHARVIKSFPEVETVVSQHGRPDDGTDATGFFNVEFFVPLKPFDTWPSGVDKEKLTNKIRRRSKTQFPGVEFNFSQYIQDNVDEAVSGVKGENSIKVFGGDLACSKDR